jgi:hypothetical protein
MGALHEIGGGGDGSNRRGDGKKYTAKRFIEGRDLLSPRP